MKIIRTTMTCDVCQAGEAFDNADPCDWATTTIVLASERREHHVCPRCMGEFLDPADDIATEVHRFELEDRIA